MAAPHLDRDTSAKTRVGAPHDAAERHADSVADQLTAPSSAAPLHCAACAGGDSPCPACLSSARYLRRNAAPFAATPKGLAPEVGAALGQPGTALPDALRNRFERRLGADLSSVRLHTGPDATRAADSMHANAFALGPDIVVANNQYQPHTRSGQHLLAHEVAHVVQDEATPTLRRDDKPGTGADPATLESLIRVQPPGFSDAQLDSAYQRYLVTEKAAADPATWALRQTAGKPRDRLVHLLGPDYARGQRSGTARPPLDLSSPSAPPGYDPTRQQQDLATLQASGAALTARLGNMQYDPATGMQISAGHQAILQGNVGEALARPLLEQALQDIRKTEPAAQLFLGVTAQLKMADGGWTNPVLFTDGLIGVVDGIVLRVIRVAEIKSGLEGGVQGQEQVHRWIEGHSTSGLRILLPGIARPFEFSETVREVRKLTTAARLVVVPSDARFAGARSGHGTTAAIIPMRLSQSSAEISYLTSATALRLLLESRARQLLETIRAQQLKPALIGSTLELQQSSTIARLQTESGGLALVNGVLFRVGADAGGRQLTRLPLQTMQLPAAPGTQAPGGQTRSPAPGPATPLTGSTPQTPPAGAAGPLQVPGIPGTTQLAPGVSIPSNVLNLSGQPIVVGGGRVVPPSQPVELREGDIVVRGASGGVVAFDITTGRPVAAVLEGGRLYSVAAAGRVISVGEDGRATVSRTPQLVPLNSEPVAGGTGPGGTGASGPVRAAAAGMALFVVVNEILGPIGRNLQQQRHNIAVGQAQIDFWAQFGGNPRHAVWSIVDGREAAGVEADTATFGSGSYPYVRAIDTESFGRTLPTLITSYRDFLLFLDMAKVLDTINEIPAMPGFPTTEERQQVRRYYAMVEAPDRSLRQRIDVTDIIVPLGERLLGSLDADMRAQLSALPEAERQNVFRLKHGSETSLFRSASGGQPILSDQQLLGDDPWVRTLGREQEGGVGKWFFHGQWRDRVLVAPANADAERAAQVSSYAIKKPPDEVLEEVEAGNRPILSRSPPDGDVVSFVAGPEPGNSRFGETRYYRHINWPDVRWTVAIGELNQFWVNARDLEPVGVDDVNRYAAGPATR
jgi:hypothetical protein